MDRFRTLLVVGCLIGVLAPVGWICGETVPESDRLTLADCVRLAIAQNPLRAASRSAVESARHGVGEARAPYYPTADFGTGFSRWQRHAFLPADLQSYIPVDVIGPTDDWFMSVYAQYVVFDSGARRAGLQAARALETSATADDEQTLRNLIAQVEQAFFQLLGVQAELDAARKSRDRAGEHLRLAQERKASGSVPLLDVLRAEVEVSNADLSIIEVENSRRIVQGNLNSLMGRPVEQQLEPVPTTDPSRDPVEIRLADAMAQAVARRPEIRSAGARIVAARAGVTQAKSAYGPRVTGDGQFGWHDDEFAPSDQEWVFGLSIRLPLFTGFANEHRLGKAKAEASRAEAQAASQELSVRREVWTAYSILQKAHAAVLTSDIQTRHAGESLRLARERYTVGASTITDLIDAQTALARAEAAQARTRWEYQAAHSEFRRVTATTVIPPDAMP
ncbi:MAG: TolC family protein [Acidobacteria bacterium]|nr:TolC family protein [Acidobacteriota bacterium]